jgi:hypothetical protein
MALITLSTNPNQEILVLPSESGNGLITFIIAENKSTKGMVSLDANMTAILIRILREAYIALAES